MRYILTPEQAHELVDGAYKGHPCNENDAHHIISRAKNTGKTIEADVRRGYACLRGTAQEPFSICALYVPATKSYIKAHGIEAVKDE